MTGRPRSLQAAVTLSLVLVTAAGCGTIDRNRSIAADDSTSTVETTIVSTSTGSSSTVASSTRATAGTEPSVSPTTPASTVVDRSMGEEEVADLEETLDELDRLLGDIEADLDQD